MHFQDYAPDEHFTDLPNVRQRHRRVYRLRTAHELLSAFVGDAGLPYVRFVDCGRLLRAGRALEDALVWAAADLCDCGEHSCDRCDPELAAAVDEALALWRGLS